MAGKTGRGNFFEDFRLGQVFEHATPRTVTGGDVSLHIALTGSRFPLHSADPFARALGYRAAPLDDLLAFHLVFGKTVADISANAIANLGYADCRFGAPLYRGDTIRARSEVIGVRENSNRKSGIVYVRSLGFNQGDETVLDYVRWVMVPKRDEAAPAPKPQVPKLPDAVAPENFILPPDLDLANYDRAAAGSPFGFNDYAVGEKIDHRDGVTIEEAEHAMATRLYQNNARVHFDGLRQGAAGRLIYGGHVISIARTLSINGLANGFRIAAINGGRHVAPAHAGDTIHAWSEVLESRTLPGRDDLGALRVRTIATKDRTCHDFPGRIGDAYDPSVLLDLDYWLLMPR